MPNINRLTLCGHAGRDSEIRATPSGARVWVCSLAASQGKDKPPTWVTVELWESDAMKAHPQILDALVLIRKGDPYYAEGKLGTRTYTDKTGKERTELQLKAFEVMALAKRDAAQGVTQPRAGGHDDLPF